MHISFIGWWCLDAARRADEAELNIDYWLLVDIDGTGAKLNMFKLIYWCISRRGLVRFGMYHRLFTLCILNRPRGQRVSNQTAVVLLWMMIRRIGEGVRCSVIRRPKKPRLCRQLFEQWHSFWNALVFSTISNKWLPTRASRTSDKISPFTNRFYLIFQQNSEKERPI